MRGWIEGALLAVLFAAPAAYTQTTTENQARSYVVSAFITGAAPAILDERVAMGARLQKQLALGPDADRRATYDALIALTEDKPIAVRKPTADELGSVPERLRDARQPLFALEAGEVKLLVQYDLERNNISYVGFAEPAAATGASAPEEARLVAAADSNRAPLSGPATLQSIRLTPVQFGFDSAALSVAAKVALERDGLPKLVGSAESRFVLDGHADRIGPVAYNLRLSERRALAVRDYLVTRGVDAARIEVHGLGSAKPQTECAERERDALIACLAPDRRVDVAIELAPL